MFGLGFRSWFPAEVLGVNQLGVKEQVPPLPYNTMYVRSFGTSDIRVAKKIHFSAG